MAERTERTRTRTRSVAPVALAALLLLVLAGACSGSGDQVSTASSTEAPGTTLDPRVADALSGAAGKGTTSTTAAAVAADAIRSIDFGDFTYAPDTCGDDTERDPFVVRGGSASSASGANLSVDVTNIAYGDLTGDGVDDAVVLVSCNAGGNVAWVIPLVYTVDADGKPERLGILAGDGRGDRQVTGASISDGQIVTDEAVFLPDDPRCCPSATGATIWEWDGTTFVIVNSTEAGGPDDGATPTKSGSGDPFLITPDGVGPFYLGMTADALAANGVGTVAVEPMCGTSTYEAVGAPDGLFLILDDAGSVRAISVSSPAYLTAQNANVDSFDFDLQAVYPNLEYASFGPDLGGQFIVPAADRSSSIFFNMSGEEVMSITVTWGDSSFMDLC